MSIQCISIIIVVLRFSSNSGLSNDTLCIFMDITYNINPTIAILPPESVARET